MQDFNSKLDSFLSRFYDACYRDMYLGSGTPGDPSEILEPAKARLLSLISCEMPPLILLGSQLRSLDDGNLYKVESVGFDPVQGVCFGQLVQVGSAGSEALKVGMANLMTRFVLEETPCESCPSATSTSSATPTEANPS